MFKGLISKSVIRDNIHILIPNSLKDEELLILISHGSGGIGSAQYNTAEYFLSKGYRVGLLDYFSKYNISHLWWSYEKDCRDNYRVSFETMLTNFTLPHQYKIVHIGFSLGGFLGILNSHRFYKNFCFYPGIIGFTKEIIEKDFTNTTAFIAEKDDWCEYELFEANCIKPPTKINVDAFHGFMILDKDREIRIAKYNLPSSPLSHTEFYNLKPCHTWLNFKYGYTPKTIRLQYHKESCIMCLNQIYKDLE